MAHCDTHACPPLQQSASRRLNIVDLTPMRASQDNSEPADRRKPGKVKFQIDAEDDDAADAADSKSNGDSEGGADDEDDDDDDLDLSLVVPERVKRPAGESPAKAPSAGTSGAATRDVSRVASGTTLVSLAGTDQQPLMAEDHARLQEAAPRLSSRAYAGPIKVGERAPSPEPGSIMWCTLRPVHFDMQGQMSPLNSKGVCGGGGRPPGVDAKTAVRLRHASDRRSRAGVNRRLAHHGW